MINKDITHENKYQLTTSSTNVEKINQLTNQITSLTNTNTSLNKTIADLTSENKNLTEKLKVFVTKEYSELFTNGELITKKSYKMIISDLRKQFKLEKKELKRIYLTKKGS